MSLLVVKGRYGRIGAVHIAADAHRLPRMDPRHGPEGTTILEPHNSKYCITDLEPQVI